MATSLSTGSVLFENPLARWGNDDLLLTPEARADFDRAYPGLLRVVDWPELRALFASHDALANTGKRHSRRAGILAVLISGIGVALLALVPVLQSAFHADPRRMSAAAFAMMCVGTILGLYHWIVMRQRHEWLEHRFWTERLRQLHFQFLLGHPDLACAAIEDDAAFAELVLQRRRRLNEFVQRHDARAAIREIANDLAESQIWLVRPASASSLAEPPRLADLLDALGALRLRVQLDYVGRALNPSLRGPALRARLFTGVTDALMLAALAVSALLALSYVRGDLAGSQAGSSALGMIGAVGLVLRAVEHGERASAETERLNWYRASLLRIAERFDGGDARDRLTALADLEVLSYQELRRFLVTHSSARFIA